MSNTEFVYKDIMGNEILESVHLKKVEEYIILSKKNKEDANKVGYPNF